MVYVVRCGDEMRCAKVYKEATQRASDSGGLHRESQGQEHAPGARRGQGHPLRPAAQERLAKREVDALYRWLRPACACPGP